jgi:hypothetical protein
MRDVRTPSVVSRQTDSKDDELQLDIESTMATLPYHRAMTAKPNVCLELPVELWSEILQRVDDPYYLWVECRHVSKRFKIEAEHAFRMQFLPRLRFNWLHQGDEEDAKLISIIALFDSARSDPRAPTAFFELMSRVPAMPDLPDNERLSLTRQALDRDDIDAFLRHADIRYQHAPPQAMIASFDLLPSLNRYVNDPELPNLQIHPVQTPYAHPMGSPYVKQGHISLDWKEFMTKFFAEEVHVRRKAKTDVPITPFHSLPDLLSSSCGSLGLICPSFTESGGVMTILLKEQPAYLNVRSNFIQSAVGSLSLDATHIALFGTAAGHQGRIQGCTRGRIRSTPPQSVCQDRSQCTFAHRRVR